MRVQNKTGTQAIAELIRIVKFRWQEFEQNDKEFISNFFEVNENYDPPLVNM